MNRDALLRPVFILAVAGGLLPLGASYWWGFELFSHFRIQYLALAALLVVVGIVTRHRRLALLVAAVAGINSLPVLPYLGSTTTDTPTAMQIGVLNVNVNSQNTEYARVVDAIRAADADLVAILELSPELDHVLMELADRYFYRFSAPEDSNFGMGVLSRHPLVSMRSFAIGSKMAIDTLVELPAGRIRFLAVHLVPPKNSSLALERNLQLDRLADYANQFDEPLLVCGDFNLTPYSPYFERFASAAQLEDTRLGLGLDFSWPTFMPILGIPIDHCFTRGPIAVDSIVRLDRIGSDHYPVQLKLVMQNDE